MTATATTAADIPSVQDHEVYRAAVERHADLSAKLADATRERLAMEKALGADAKLTERQLQARAMLRGEQAGAILERIDQLTAVREQEAVLTEAVALANAAIAEARAVAIRELAPVAVRDCVVPAAREAADAYLVAVSAIVRHADLIGRLRSAGLGNGLAPLFGATAGVTRRDNMALEAFRGLIRAGYIDAERVNELLPDYLSRGF